MRTTTPTRIAIVGGGPTAVYTLKNLLQKAGRMTITLFEAGKVAGCGIPYAEEFNTPDMMANITSIEIPPVLISLADWVRVADSGLLRRFGIDRETVSDRDFYPRVLIGAYYSEQLERLIAAGAQSGQQVTVETESRVTDVRPDASGFTVFVTKTKGNVRRRFDTVIMATGHLTDQNKAERDGGLYRSPYPVQDLKVGPDGAALILGSSLSGIDAVVALASRYGQFTGEGDALRYSLKGKQKLRLVMASRKGVTPDADFYYPIPEEPLMVFTEARLEALQKQGKTGFLSRAMKLFKQQLAADDPKFLADLGISRFTPESFAKGYFGMRKARQGFEAMAENLAESQKNYAERRIVMWRYTLMRAHEVFSQIVPFFDRKDLARFRRYLVPVFADAYGCVPHLSVQRLLALHRAGCLELAALGETGVIRYGAGNFTLTGAGPEQVFGTFIDARGQEMTSIRELGFTELDRALESKDFLRRSLRESDDDQFRIPLGERMNPDIFCLSIPVMMKRYPFAQGLVACSDAAKLVAEAL
ncbi:FAD/NAD(P)-binding protein [Devosia chinhatensis]|uniref:FAD/NAD(P)-binding protein n=1 Tax=Devosia chinhatensis TaxID=429727 RepID=UPI000698DE72|nr:FAD/NAD(P)-binding protein [Devosia chinhatensis]